MIDLIILTVIIGLMLFLGIYVGMVIKWNENKKLTIIITSDNTKVYKEELDKMILYQTVYQIDILFGDTFRDRKAVTADVDNDDIYEAVNQIGPNVISNMSDMMKEYLYTVFGKEWIFNYINIQSLSLALNYTRFNINSLTKNLFK